MTWTTVGGSCSSKIWRQAMKSDASRNRMMLTAVLATLSLAASGALAEEQPSIPPAQLVRETVRNEINSNNDQAKFMFREHKITPKGSQTKLVRLKFRQTPGYNPPSRVEQVLTAMQGILLIDEQAKRIAKIDGTLVKNVGFGWGILGHLDRGGHFLVEQADVAGGHWEMSRMDLSFTGKALFFKNLSFKSNEIYSDFRPAPPNLTFAQGVELLKRHEAELLADREQKGGR